MNQHSRLHRIASRLRPFADVITAIGALVLFFSWIVSSTLHNRHEKLAAAIAGAERQHEVLDDLFVVRGLILQVNAADRLAFADQMAALPVPPQGPIQGLLQGSFRGELRAPPEGPIQSSSQGLIEGPFQAPVQGVPQGLLQGAIQGAIQSPFPVPPKEERAYEAALMKLHAAATLASLASDSTANFWNRRLEFAKLAPSDDQKIASLASIAEEAQQLRDKLDDVKEEAHEILKKARPDLNQPKTPPVSEMQEVTKRADELTATLLKEMPRLEAFREQGMELARVTTDAVVDRKKVVEFYKNAFDRASFWLYVVGSFLVLGGRFFQVFPGRATSGRHASLKVSSTGVALRKSRRRALPPPQREMRATSPASRS